MTGFVLGVILLLVGGVFLFTRKGTSFRAKVLFLIGGAGFVLVSSVRVVDTGTVAIPVVFGKAQPQLSSGIKLVNPFVTLEELSIRTEEWTLGKADNADGGSVPVKGNDGASGVVSATLLFRLDPDEASTVYRELGTDYENMIIRPTMRTCIREGFAEFAMVSAATTRRTEIDADVHDCIEAGIAKYGFFVVDFQLRDIEVDESVQAAVDRKVEAEQSAEAKLFDLEAARIDAEIKRTEAKAIADAEQIIVCGAVEEETTAVDGQGNEVQVTTLRPKEGAACENNLTPEYLELQRIHALEQFAQHGNSIITDTGVEPKIQLPATAGS